MMLKTDERRALIAYKFNLLFNFCFFSLGFLGALFSLEFELTFVLGLGPPIKTNAFEEIKWDVRKAKSLERIQKHQKHCGDMAHVTYQVLAPT
jgi:hypothetical protein